MPVLKANEFVYPFHVGEHKHFTLSVKGMYALADAVEDRDPTLAHQLRREATARGIAAFQRLNPETPIHE